MNGIPMNANPVQVAVIRGCWNCGSHAIFLRPDAAMQNMTDEIVCRECGEVQE